MSSRTEFTQRSEILQDFLEVESQWAGRESGFVQRRSKLTPALFVEMLVLGLLANGAASLGELVQGGRRLGERLSESALAQRMGETGIRLLQCLVHKALERMGETALPDQRVLVGFTAVNLADSTQISLAARCATVFKGSGGSASPAGVKLQVVLNYLTGAFKALELGSGNVPDQRCSLVANCATPGSLNLFDLGYFKLTLLEAIAKVGAFFVTRFPTTVNVYWHAADPDKADLIAYLEQQGQDSGEVTLYLGTRARLPIRLVYCRRPPDQVARARRRAHQTAQKHGRTCSQQQLAWLGWYLCITNVPASRWTARQVLLVYRLRWQIELVFKLWKSQAQLDVVRYQRPDHVQCLLYAHLLGLLLFQWVVAPYRATATTELSFPKAFRLFQQAIPSLIRRVARHWTHVPQLLARLVNELRRFAQKSSRVRLPSTRRRLLLEGI